MGFGRAACDAVHVVSLTLVGGCRVPNDSAPRRNSYGVFFASKRTDVMQLGGGGGCDDDIAETQWTTRSAARQQVGGCKVPAVPVARHPDDRRSLQTGAPVRRRKGSAAAAAVISADRRCRFVVRKRKSHPKQSSWPPG